MTKHSPHRIVRGDSLDKLRKVPDGSAQLVLTDPPYGIGYQPKKGQAIANDKRPFIWWMHDAYRVCADGGSLLCFTRWDVQDQFKLAIEAAGFRIRSQVVWNKGGGGMGDIKAQFCPSHELIWFATKGRFAFPAKRPTSSISVPKPTHKERTHPTEKPVDLLTQLIEATTREGELVIDPFAGTGSCGVACVKTRRRFLGIELEGRYASKARERINRERGVRYAERTTD